MRLALVVVLAATGATVPRADAGSVPSAGRLVGTSPSAGPPSASSRIAGDEPAVDDVTVTQLDVVVPPVTAAGTVVESPDVIKAQAEPDVVVTDDVVQDRVQSDVVEAGDFQTLGVTWPADVEVTDPDIEVRTRAGGEWTEWFPLEATDSAPDPGTAEAARAIRGGTESLWVGDADAVQLSFPADAAGGPDGLSLALVDVPEVAPIDLQTASFSPSAGTAVTRAQSAVFRTDGSTSVDEPYLALQSTALTAVGPAALAVPDVVPMAPVPTIITREQWGARPQVCTPDVATTHGLIGAVVHHTAGSNGYSTIAEAMQQIRGDQAYHIDGRGWCDIGYNFVVDKWGNIYEGRANSLTQPVIGVHAGGFNTGTVGVSMVGTYGDPPPAATVDSVGRIIGLRLAAYDIDPRGSFVYNTLGGENSKYPAGSAVPLPRIFTHRDVAYTACPGNGGWAAVNAIRVIAGTYLDSKRYVESGSVVKALYQDLLGRAPDPVGYQAWRSVLMTGSQSALVLSLTSSDEYIALRVRQAYTEVLGRQPDPVGAAGWLAAIRERRATVDDVQRTFYDSEEYFLVSGGTPQGYVARLYTTMLGRGASVGEVATWVGLMGSRGRAWVVDSIWFSVEAAQHRAGAYYQTFLGRGPDPVGLEAWARVLLSQGEGAVRAGIAGSDEYRMRAIARYPSSSDPLPA